MSSSDRTRLHETVVRCLRQFIAGSILYNQQRDRRSVLVHLDPAKVKKMQAFYGEINDCMAALLDETPERELRSVVKLLSKMNASRVEAPG